MGLGQEGTVGERYSYMHIEKSSLVLVVVLFTFSIRLSQ